jgi:hypothetical protein
MGKDRRFKKGRIPINFAGVEPYPRKMRKSKGLKGSRQIESPPRKEVD